MAYAWTEWDRVVEMDNVWSWVSPFGAGERFDPFLWRQPLRFG